MGDRQDVVVRDIQMSFGSMVMFMVKWSLATIPAVIILGILGGILFAAFMSFVGA